MSDSTSENESSSTGPAPTASRGQLGDRIVRASIAVGIAHLSFKFLGLIQAIVAGQAMNDRVFDIVYVFAFEGIIFSIFFRMGEETIGPCFLPVFQEQMSKHGEDAAWAFTNIIISVQTLLLLAAIAGIMLLPDQVIEMGTYWNRSVDPERHALARHALVWIAPALLCLSIGSTTYMVLNGYKRFFLAAFGVAGWKIAVVCALLVGTHADVSIDQALIVGLLIGSVAKLAIHLVGLRDKLRRLRPLFSLSHPAVKAMLLLMLPMIAGTVFAIIRDYYNNVYVLSSIDTPGIMKANSFGRKLFLAIGWLVPYTVSIAMLPFFCELVDDDDRERLGAIITQSGRMLLAVFVPGAVLIAVLSEPIAMVLFRGGEFTAETVRWAALSNAVYSLVLPAYALEYILMQGYFANRKMTWVILIGIPFSLGSVLVSYFFIVRFGYRGVDALKVVAAGYVLSRVLKTTTLVIVLRRVVPAFPVRETVGFLLRLLPGTVLVGAVAYGVTIGFEQLISAADGKVILLLKGCTAGVAAGIVFLAAAWACRVREPFDMARWAWDKVRAKLGRS
jgi:peptidoglycan biosynthesis protein MviN/MurJ (putative lipid II flippase)